MVETETRAVADADGIHAVDTANAGEMRETGVQGEGLLPDTAVRSLSVVIPVYNSAATLSPLLARLLPVLAGIGVPYEVILVNDGSRDGSEAGIAALATSHPDHVRGISLMRNYGQHNALLCGVRAARYGTIVTIDDDLQHPPEEIPRLLAVLAEGYDVVYGTPRAEQHGVLRNLASQVTKLALQSAMGADTARNVSAFRAFHTDLRDAFAEYRNPFISLDVLLTWATERFGILVVRRDPRRVGVSNYTLRKLITHALNMTTGFSTLPLQFASLIGFAFTLFGVAILAYVLIRYVMSGGLLPGFAFLASIIALFSGAQLLALGIIGEYLSRMHVRTQDKPSYVVRARWEILPDADPVSPLASTVAADPMHAAAPTEGAR